MAQAFVKTFKRDYYRVIPIPDATTTITPIPLWMADCNDVQIRNRHGYRSPRAFIRATLQPAEFPA